MSGDVVIRPLAADELPAYHAALELAFHEPPSPEVQARQAAIIELDRTAVAFDGELLVGTSAAQTFRVSIPGGELPCAGVTAVTVRPTHRRRGILRRMMAALLADARRRREPLAALWASEGGIYGRFGYGVATWEARLEVARAGVPPRPPREDGLRVELRALAGSASLLAPLWDCTRSQRGGMTDRTPTWWDARVLTDPAAERHGALEQQLALVRDAAGTARGYARYRIQPVGEQPGTVELIELIAPDPDADAALWQYLCGIDLVRRLDAPRRPVDDPLPLLFDDVRRARVSAIGEALWLRLLDVPVALSARTWASTVDVTLALTDPEVPENDGSWRLETSAGAGARCTRTDRTPDVALGVRELSAAYLGGTPLARLAGAGMLQERTPGALARLDEALHVPYAPWTPELF